MKTVFHVDSFPLKHHQIDNNGYLRFVAPIARTGKLTYLDKEGNRYEENVPAETLIKSLDSFKTKPVTNPHPPVRLNAHNTKNYARGLSGYTGFFDGSFLWLTGTVTDHDVIQKIIKKDESEISPGYDALVKDESSILTQVKRIGNHLSVIKRGRNGRDVAFKTDSADDDSLIQVYYQDEEYELGDLTDTPESLLEGFKSDIQYFITPKSPEAFRGDSVDLTKEFEKIKKDKKKVAQILLNDEVYTIDGDDADRLKTAISDDKKAKLALTTKLDEAITLTETLKAEKTTLESSVAALKTDKEALQTKVDEAPKPGAKGDNSGLGNRLMLWQEVTPSIQKYDPAFKLDSESEELLLSPIEIKQYYLIKRDQASGNDERADQILALDMSTEKAQMYVEGLYDALKPGQHTDSIDEPSHSDSVLNRLLKGKRVEPKADSDSTDPRAALTSAIESNGKAKT